VAGGVGLELGEEGGLVHGDQPTYR
jgi:hypothetical protein